MTEQEPSASQLALWMARLDTERRKGMPASEGLDILHGAVDSWKAARDGGAALDAEKQLSPYHLETPGAIVPL